MNAKIWLFRKVVSRSPKDDVRGYCSHPWRKGVPPSSSTIWMIDAKEEPRGSASPRSVYGAGREAFPDDRRGEWLVAILVALRLSLNPRRVDSRGARHTTRAPSTCSDRLGENAIWRRGARLSGAMIIVREYPASQRRDQQRPFTSSARRINFRLLVASSRSPAAENRADAGACVLAPALR